MAITKIDLSEAEAAEIRSHDQLVDEEEGGAKKIIRGSKPARVARTSR